MNKQTLREQYGEERKKIHPAVWQKSCIKISHALVSSPLWADADTISIYSSFGMEVDTKELIKHWWNKKRLVIPCISGTSLEARTVDTLQFKRNTFGIEEPTGPVVDREDIDLFVVPGIAFSTQGYRIGFGEGYYDRFLDGVNKPKVGITFRHALLDHIPHEPHDITMNWIVTEEGLIKCP